MGIWSDVVFQYLSFILKIDIVGSSGQDGGLGRNPSLPQTTKRRITTNLKSINNQKCQKIKLYKTLTTKELKKKSTRTIRLVRTHSEAGQVGLAEQELGLRADCGLRRELLRWEKTPRLTWESIGKWAIDEEGSCIVPSLAPPPQAVRSTARVVLLR